ncbi:putative bifunctional diguanylate cyclase/phosphodiesterase [Litorilituus lipolyticus]|uniref:EAL domain-containing protein n=1 Tax=Litorilituus lipolyticus TaxID=2491017 RepID=A0A502L5W8_9GAMM|nr:EAL domain-containing protein [Litorilituus lipolyticus]TPH19330.1 EAL domain-containing protein [Litorilituus lipolyticus]
MKESKEVLNNKRKRKPNSSKRVVVLTSIIILMLLIWQAFSANKIHQSYQHSLMKSVTDRVISDYLEYFSQLRLEIDLFQQKHFYIIQKLKEQGDEANKELYMELLTKLRDDIENTRLFSFINQHGQGSLSHITGNFLPDCEEEIAATLAAGVQESLFLHRSKSSVHFDILQPFSSVEANNEYLFVAFNPNVLIGILSQYQLPHQQLFLMRSDQRGHIELTTETTDVKYARMVVNDFDYDSFSYIKPIPNTRWQLGIRLSPQYNIDLRNKALSKALIIWLILTTFVYGFYRQQKRGIQKHRRVKKELAYADSHDQLTGLANRNNFEQQVTHFINNNSKTPNKSGVVLKIDLDKFQVINNSMGFTVGDKFLHQISLILQKNLPTGAVLSRLGNDEFAMLLPDLQFSEAENYANKIRCLLKDTHIEESSQSNNITASVGVVIIDNSIFDVQQVFSSLGQAISLAKEKGRDRVQVYQSSDEQLRKHAKEMEAVHELVDALKEQRLLLHRQEIKSMVGEYSKYFEVLVRMKNKQGDIVPPIEFIPAAEKYGMIVQLDYWVIEHTLKGMANEQAGNHYSINLSGITLANKELYQHVKGLFKTYKVEPSLVSFEITETSAITHLDSALYFINNMIAFGCSFALDDFGSGLSSFSYLQKLPIGTIKIDGAFVRDMDSNAINRTFVENIKRTASAMNKKVVAEFVENEHIEALLNEIGVEYVQGYYIHKPELWFEQQKL